MSMDQVFICDMQSHAVLVHWLLYHTHKCVVHRSCTAVYVNKLLAQQS